MDQLEKVEKLREKANVTYEEAKEALEASNWDLLDAMVYLEKAGKIKGNQGRTYSTQYEDTNNNSYDQYSRSYNYNTKKPTFGEECSNFFKWLGKAIGKSTSNYFEIERHNEIIFSIPILLFVLLLLIFNALSVILLVIGLFCDCKYKFNGPDIEGSSINNAMNKASEAAEDIKKDFNK